VQLFRGLQDLLRDLHPALLHSWQDRGQGAGAVLYHSWTPLPHPRRQLDHRLQTANRDQDGEDDQRGDPGDLFLLNLLRLLCPHSGGQGAGSRGAHGQIINKQTNKGTNPPPIISLSLSLNCSKKPQGTEINLCVNNLKKV